MISGTATPSLSSMPETKNQKPRPKPTEPDIENPLATDVHKKIGETVLYTI